MAINYKEVRKRAEKKLTSILYERVVDVTEEEVLLDRIVAATHFDVELRDKILETLLEEYKQRYGDQHN